MGRLSILGLTLATVMALVAFSGDGGSEGSGDTGHDGIERPSPAAAHPSPEELRRRRRATRWTCSVRHATTGNYYRCTEGAEDKSCRCAIAKCKHWNPGSARQCSSACKCKKK